MVDLVIRNARVVTENGVILGGVAVKDGRFAAIAADDALPPAKTQLDAGGMVLMPGNVDPHVHVEYPGAAHCGDFVTETRAAAAGGVTTIVEHPICIPPNYSRALTEKRAEYGHRDCLVDFAFIGAAGGEKLEEIAENGRCGILGYKTFLNPPAPGREREFEGLTMKDNYEIFLGTQEVAKTGLPLLVHCEDHQIIDRLVARFREEGTTSPIFHAKSRPPITEVMTVEKMIRFAREMDLTLYLVHLSCPESIRMAKKAREEGVRVWIETCPHYLYFCEDELEKYGTYAKCNPPLRPRAMMEELWQYVADGTVDTIGSDHSPYTVAEKENQKEDIFVAPPGLTGIETTLPLMLTAVDQGKITLERAAQLMSTNPSKIFGIYPQKGAIRVGSDADMTLVEMGHPYQLDSKTFFTDGRGASINYDGVTVSARVNKTFVRGQLIFDQGKIVGEQGFGQWVKPLPRK